MSGNYFSKRKIKPSMALNLCDDNRSFCVSHCVLNEVLKYCLVFVYLVCIYRRQYRRIRGGRRLRRGRGGTLYQLYQLCQLYQSRQANTNASNTSARLARILLQIILFSELYQSQVFILQAFIYQSLFIVHLCLSLELLQELQAQSRQLQCSQLPLTSRSHS